jgi:hypothetical protein
VRAFAGSPSASVVRARGARPWRSARSRRQWPWLSSSASGSSRGLIRFGPRTAARSHSGCRAPRTSAPAPKSGELPGDRRHRRKLRIVCDAAWDEQLLHLDAAGTANRLQRDWLANGVRQCAPAEGDRRRPVDRRPFPARRRPAGPVLGAGAGTPPGPLVRYLHHRFAPIAKFGDYELLKREGSGNRS